MTEEAVCIGVDVAKNTLDVAVSNLKELRQFNNDDDGIIDATRYITSLKPTRIILEATGNFEMPLAAIYRLSSLIPTRYVILLGLRVFWPRLIALTPGYSLSSDYRLNRR